MRLVNCWWGLEEPGGFDVPTFRVEHDGITFTRVRVKPYPVLHDFLFECCSFYPVNMRPGTLRDKCFQHNLRNAFYGNIRAVREIGDNKAQKRCSGSPSTGTHNQVEERGALQLTSRISDPARLTPGME